MFKVFLLPALWLTAFLAQGQVTLSGFVRDAHTDQPLPGATVVVTGTDHVAVADENGSFTFAGISPGDYTVRASYVGYANGSQTVSLTSDQTITFLLDQTAILTEAVVVSATRASDKTPTTHSTVTKDAIREQNFGQDLPFLLNWTPSVVTTSDAGTGIGYTGIRIRGSDATRINVTINGIPYNDSESQGTFWVNIPDIASSSENIQIQRGVGTSTNGAGAFGATIDMQTLAQNSAPYAEVTNSFGSFNTRRHTLNAGTGLLKNHFTIDGRVSRITSDGFIDRADADLSSYYLSAGYYDKKTIVKAILFGGRERTYQSWYGVPESRLNNDTEAMMTTAANEGWNDEQTQNLLQSDSRTFNPYLYENQVDNYRQDHYQLHFSRRLAEGLTWNTALHYTRGQGYYEEYRYDEDLADYGLTPLPDDGSVDLVRRRWLDNHFYGTTYSLSYDVNDWNLIVGGAWNRYIGDHFGEIIWAEIAPVAPGHRYYFNDAAKRDFNLYAKAYFQVIPRLNIFGDVQYRTIDYRIDGIESKLETLDVSESYTFFNPKVGLTFALNDRNQLYTSYSIGNREPVRDDFTDNPGGAPKHETLRNLELGFRNRGKNHSLVANYYLMDYHNQLVLTGQLNDVGASVRTNVDRSYRTGIELEGQLRLGKHWTWRANATFSQNRIKEFTEVLYDYGADFDEYHVVENTYRNTDISFSPAVIAGSGLTYSPAEQLSLTWLAKYVGKQYLDNTSNENRVLDPYFVNDLRIEYRWEPAFVSAVTFSFMVNNIFDIAYESNGYTWGYLAGPVSYRENYYFPQAGRNFMGMISVRF